MRHQRRIPPELRCRFACPARSRGRNASVPTGHCYGPAPFPPPRRPERSSGEQRLPEDGDVPGCGVDPGSPLQWRGDDGETPWRSDEAHRALRRNQLGIGGRICHSEPVLTAWDIRGTQRSRRSSLRASPQVTRQDQHERERSEEPCPVKGICRDPESSRPQHTAAYGFPDRPVNATFFQKSIASF
jgi:hypothetical protein